MPRTLQTPAYVRDHPYHYGSDVMKGGTLQGDQVALCGKVTPAGTRTYREYEVTCRQCLAFLALEELGIERGDKLTGYEITLANDAVCNSENLVSAAARDLEEAEKALDTAKALLQRKRHALSDLIAGFYG